MNQVVTLTVFFDECLAAIDPVERAAILIMANALIFGVKALRAQDVGQPQRVERVSRWGAQRDSGTDLGKYGSLLEHNGSKTRSLQSECCRKSANTATYDADVQILHERY